MLMNATINETNYSYRNGGYLASTYYGASVVAALAPTYSSWASLGSALQSDTFGLLLGASGFGVQTQNNPTIVRIGVDPAGGTSYTALLNDMLYSGSNVYYAGGFRNYYPIYIKKGSTLAFSSKYSIGARSGSMNIQTFEAPLYPATAWCGTYSETLGFTSGSLGTTFTPGNATKGAWTALGTTTRNWKYVQLTACISNGTLTPLICFIDVAVGDGSNYTTILQNHVLHQQGTNETCSILLKPPEMCFRDIPAGSTLYVRGACDISPPTGFMATVVGIG